MTIKDILEKVDLFNITTVDEDFKTSNQKNKEFKANFNGGTNFQKAENGKTIIQLSDPTSAYLGPKLWDTTISMPDLESDVEDFGEVIDMDKFLSENNILVPCPEEEETTVVVEQDLVVVSPSSHQEEAMVVSPPHMWDQDQGSPSAMDVKDIKIQQRPSIFAHTSVIKKPEPETKENNFLYVESKRARVEREKEERRRKFEQDIQFAPEDLALATVPGRDFDPRKRSFDLEELRPQPIIRKRQKTAVPEELKDDKYWDKRVKNKMATRRSREARRLKENQIALRAAFLEKENKGLRKDLENSHFENTKLSTEREILMMKLDKYEKFAAQ